MLHLIISTDSAIRIKQRLPLLAGGEVITLDDMTSSMGSLEQYAYPSLFSLHAPIVHAKYVLESSLAELSTALLATLVASPTVFVLEEKTVSVTTITLLEKAGALIHKELVLRTKARQSDIFAVTAALTSTSKKERWIVYRTALREHAPEAIIGILYWKLRQLIDAGGTKNAVYKELYKVLIVSHKEAWQRGTPLELAIEKTILQ